MDKKNKKILISITLAILALAAVVLVVSWYLKKLDNFVVNITDVVDEGTLKRPTAEELEKVLLAVKSGIRNGNISDPLTHTWEKQFWENSGSHSTSIVVDVFNNIYITGRTFGNLDGNINIGGDDAFLTKYDSDGNRKWTRQFGTKDFDEAIGVKTDAKGNIYVVGDAEGAFLAKYDTDGNKKWMKKFGDTEGRGSISDVVVDKSNNMYIVRESRISHGSEFVSVSLSKFDSDGNHLWTKNPGISENGSRINLAIDSKDSVYLIIEDLKYKTLLVKYDRLGKEKIVKELEDIESGAFSVSIDDKDNIYLLGFTGLFKSWFEGGETFIAKYDQAGKRSWLSRFVVKLSGNYGGPHGVAVNSSGDVYITGSTAGISDEEKAGRGGLNGFLAKYDTDGNKKWMKQFGTMENDFINGIATDSFGAVYITGEASGIFLLKYDPKLDN